MKRDPELHRIAIECLTPKTQAKSIRFLVEKVGPDAAQPLRAAVAADANPDVRKGAERALDRIDTVEINWAARVRDAAVNQVEEDVRKPK